MARPASNVCWASLDERGTDAVQTLIDTKPSGWKAELYAIVRSEQNIHEMCDNWIKSDYLAEWYRDVTA